MDFLTLGQVTEKLDAYFSLWMREIDWAVFIISLGWVAFGLILAAGVYALGRRLIYQALSRVLALFFTDHIEPEGRRIAGRLALFFSFCVIYNTFSHVLMGMESVQDLAESIVGLMLAASAVATLFAVLDLGLKIYSFSSIASEIPLKGVVQVVKIVALFLAGLSLIASILNQSATVLLSGLGALSAILILVFRDSLMGFVGGLQLIANRMVATGDWIEMPKYGADGDVIDIALTTVKVRNWDKTITCIPTYALISESFKNWRGMQESGGRRIKRTINIDLSTIKFCDQQALERFSKIQYIADYIQRKQDEIDAFNAANQVDQVSLVNGRRLTNVGTFRAYVEAYLRNHSKVHQEMTFLVRHKQPGDQGLPIEIYVFSNDQVWANYESIQADIFDHLIAVVPEFDLRIFQVPSGDNFQQFLAARSEG